MTKQNSYIGWVWELKALHTQTDLLGEPKGHTEVFGWEKQAKKISYFIPLMLQQFAHKYIFEAYVQHLWD